MYCYIKTEARLWTVGFYDPDGRWQTVSDHDSPDEAADRVAHLNGNAKRNDKAYIKIGKLSRNLRMMCDFVVAGKYTAANVLATQVMKDEGWDD